MGLRFPATIAEPSHSGLRVAPRVASLLPAAGALVALALCSVWPSDASAAPVTITSPASGTTYTTARTVLITAASSGNGVSKVEFYDGATLRGTDTTEPYTHAWAFTSANNGTHSWTAREYNGGGSGKSSAPVSLVVNIEVTPPTVSITSPASGTTYTTAQTVTISASASDNVGVTRVEFRDGGVLRGTDTAAPYSFSWGFTSANNGTHSWTAQAYDAAGNNKLSSTVNLTVNISSSSDTTPPTASITSPASGTSYTTAQTATISASASDNVGVAKVEFYDGAVLRGNDTSSCRSSPTPGS